jgi:uncharacterized membrane protein
MTKKPFRHTASDLVTKWASTWTFVILCIASIILWINFQKVDPFPFILLNLALSCVAALQAPIILMSSRRQAEKDSERIEEDLKTDKEALELLKNVGKKLDSLLVNRRK